MRDEQINAQSEKTDRERERERERENIRLGWHCILIRILGLIQLLVLDLVSVDGTLLDGQSLGLISR
jgi:hypothetical protein